MKPYVLFFLLVGCLLSSLLVTAQVNDQVSLQERPVRDSIPCPLSVVAPKMNIFYIGVENPVEVIGAGETIEMSTNAAVVGVKRQSSNQFVVTARIPGEITLDIEQGKEKSTAQFRVKRIPDPVASLGRKRGGDIGLGEFKAQMGALAQLENFDFDVECEIVGFQLWRISEDGSRRSVVNQGGRYTAETQALVQEASPGDIYLFHNIRARCPSDMVSRSIGTMSFFIR